MRVTTSLLLLALATGSMGCGSLSFEKQDVIIRHDVEGDALDILLIYHGVFTNLPPRVSDEERQERLEKGVAAFERIAAGARECAIGEDMNCFSIDELASKAAAKPNDIEAGPHVAIYRLITLEDHAAFVEDAKLCGFQRFKIHPWSEFEARVNALISSEVIANAEPKPKADDETPKASRCASSRQEQRRYGSHSETVSCGSISR
jgi:hypothetical protein